MSKKNEWFDDERTHVDVRGEREGESVDASE